MLPLCQTRTLYKGLLTLVLALIVIEYLFGFLIENKYFHVFPSDATIVPEKLSFQRHPIVKALIGLNTNTMNSTKNYNISSNFTAVEFSPSFITKRTLLDLFDEINNKTNKTVISLCPETPPDLSGRIQIVKEPVPSAQQLEQRFSWLKAGGHWFPETCNVVKKVAIIVPFRCRGEHLLVFLQHMHPLLRKQQLDYTIFVIEQEGNGSFNRAMLKNIGFTEALKISNFDCFIFHDIDLLPEDDRNLYTCPEQPRHMSVAVDILDYTLPYEELIGGVFAISTEHFKILNGFSNSFWGWGGEDDDMTNRIRYHKLYISRYPITIARYTMLNHKKESPSPIVNETLKAGRKKFNTDGLSNLKYTIKELKQHILYTWLLVKLELPSRRARFSSL